VVIVLAPGLFAIAYVLIAGLLSRLTMRAIVPGTFPRDLQHAVYGPRRLYGLCWTSLYYCGPIYHAVLAVPLFRRVTFRLFGYRGSLQFTVYPDTWIRDLPLLSVAEGAYLSNKATIGTNVCLKNGDILVGPVSIGKGAMIGHLSQLGPGCTVDEDAEIGVNAAVGFKAHIGARARIGPHTGIDHGAVVGAECVVGSGANIGKKAVIEDGVTIPAGFIVPPRSKVRSSADVRALGLVHRRSIVGVSVERPTQRYEP
jgi:carbonic anhydrase/acetyltransferase-like protein (isoleucine patch superfamily)